LINISHRLEPGWNVRSAVVNGDVGAVISIDGAVDLVTAFEVDRDRVVAVRIVRNPDKLAHVDRPVALL
jgi:RNA polymerase sigma-70 factor (ECF subfamily)